MSSNINKCTCFEANFELASDPVEINLELKSYLEKDSQYIPLYISEEDWVFTEAGDKVVEINLEEYNFNHCSLIDFLIYDEEDKSYHSALCDFAFQDDNKKLKLYSDDGVKCEVILFGTINL